MVELVEKKSKFIGYVFNVPDVKECELILNNLQKEHKKATHICYAYKFNNIAKCSDDGEPSGTAGLPILNVLNKNNLNNVLLVVVRYFGGIKLGAGGLTRAYSNCASKTIKSVNLKQLEECLKISFKIDFSEQKIIDTISHLEYTKDVCCSYEQQITVNCIIIKQFLNDFIDKLNRMLNINVKFDICENVLY